MKEVKEYTCIQCPIGCPLQLTHEGKEIIEIEGYSCNRGAKYGRQEFTDPRRSISTTVSITGAQLKRLPVKVTQPFPKDRILEVAKTIHQLKLQAPVVRGQVLIKNILGLDGIDVVATRSN